MSIVRKVGLSQEADLRAEDLAAVDVGSEETDIREREVESLLEVNSRHVTVSLVEIVVLLSWIIQVRSGVEVSSIFSEELDEESHQMAIRVAVRRSSEHH